MKTAVVDLVALRLVNGDGPSNMQCLVVAFGSMALVPGERAAACLMSGTWKSWRRTTNEGADTIVIYKSSCPRRGREGSDAIDTATLLKLMLSRCDLLSVARITVTSATTTSTRECPLHLQAPPGRLYGRCRDDRRQHHCGP